MRPEPRLFQTWRTMVETQLYRFGGVKFWIHPHLYFEMGYLSQCRFYACSLGGSRNVGTNTAIFDIPGLAFNRLTRLVTILVIKLSQVPLLYHSLPNTARAVSGLGVFDASTQQSVVLVFFRFIS